MMKIKGNYYPPQTEILDLPCTEPVCIAGSGDFPDVGVPSFTPDPYDPTWS